MEPLNRLNHMYRSVSRTEGHPSAAGPNPSFHKEVKGTDCDRLVLHSRPAFSEQEFVRRVSRELAADIRRTAPLSHIKELSGQLREGTYVPDSQKIAQTLLDYFPSVFAGAEIDI